MSTTTDDAIGAGYYEDEAREKRLQQHLSERLARGNSSRRIISYTAFGLRRRTHATSLTV
jgi:hypothetical protein